MQSENGIEERKTVKLYTSRDRCPICGEEKLQTDVYVYEVPYFGKILISTSICEGCGYTNKNVSTAEELQPKKIVLEVSEEQKLRYLVVKSSRAALKIREKGLQFIPTAYTPGLITTVEGLVYLFEEPINVACKNVEKNGCNELKEWLRKVANGEERFTLVLCDFDGGSKVIGEGVIEKEIDEECIELTRS
ncbi:MAG: ZPR1 zinc finger domain-containing protein [Acidilobaceae archaeon]